jgi:ribonuclease HII
LAKALHQIKMIDYGLETKLGGNVAGVDEVGRGAWAGPVFAAAAVFNTNLVNSNKLKGLNDSKSMSRSSRENYFSGLEEVKESGHAFFSVGIASVKEIDTLNILNATMLAMERAIKNLPFLPTTILVDGVHAPNSVIPTKTIPKGDSKIFSIAAASIYAKVNRDRHMIYLSKSYPGFGWETNAGYGTKEHQNALFELGINEHHRKSFSPIKNILKKTQDVVVG